MYPVCIAGSDCMQGPCTAGVPQASSVLAATDSGCVGFLGQCTIPLTVTMPAACKDRWASACLAASSPAAFSKALFHADYASRLQFVVTQLRGYCIYFLSDTKARAEPCAARLFMRTSFAAFLATVDTARTTVRCRCTGRR